MVSVTTTTAAATTSSSLVNRKRFRISRQVRDMAFLGVTMFLLGFYLRAESDRLSPYRPDNNLHQTNNNSKGNKNKRNAKNKTPNNRKNNNDNDSTALAAAKITSSKNIPSFASVSKLHVRQPGTLLHIIKTRLFQYQPNSPQLVTARIQIFRTFVLPAMVAQTKQNFFWIVSVERDLPTILVDEIKQMLQPYPHFYLTNVMLDARQQGGKDIVEKLDQSNVLSGDFGLLQVHMKEYETVPVLETRIDGDEAMNVAFVEKLQSQATIVLADKSLEWMYWCINKAMHWFWFAPGTTNSTDLLSNGAFLDNGLDENVCAIPGLTVGFRQGGKTDTFKRVRAVLLQKELATKEPWCGAMTKGIQCLNVWNDLDYPVLRIDTPATAVLEKPSKLGRTEADRVLPNGAAMAKQYFAVETESVATLHRLIRDIPPYYMNPPRVNRFKDDNVAKEIAKLNPNALLEWPDTSTYPDKYDKRNRQVFHIVKTRFMQHQPKLVALAKARIELFKAFCLPSMLYQTSQNFFWIIYTDPKLDKEIVNEMVQLLKPYPHFYLVKSLDDKRGLGGKDIKNGLTPKDFKTGDTKKLYYNLGNVHFLHVLESRLDADDAININWIKETQRRANVVFKEVDGRDWMYWCINAAVEWNWVGPGDRKQLHEYGALIHPPAYDDRHFCHTPGMTVGFRRGSFTRTVAKGPHQLLYEKLEKDELPCSPKKYKGTDCIEFIGNFTYAAVRSRTPTSASMAGVNTNGGKAYRLAAEDGAKRWKDAIEAFALQPNNTNHVIKYFFDNMKPILEDNLRGQCTEGHSCRKEAKTMLDKMIQMYSLSKDS